MTPHVLSTILLVLHWLIVVGLSLRVIKRRVPVGVSLAWLAVVFSLPVVGAVTYLLFGEKRLGRRRMARMQALSPEVAAWHAARKAQAGGAGWAPEGRGAALSRHAEQVLGSTTHTGNALELFVDFDSLFTALVADIDAAQHGCRLGFYIWFAGGRTDDVVAALIRAAGRGVRCQVLADCMGSKAFLGSGVVKRLRAAGVELTTALPAGWFRAIFSRTDLRNHRKIAVIDDRVAYTGSQNMVDPRYFKQDSGVGQWVDAMVRIQGPAVTGLDAVFHADWAVETATPFVGPMAPPAPGNPPGGSPVQVVPSGPGLCPEAIHQLLLTAIYSARRELVLTTPYFVPDEAMQTALLSAALRGVEVTLIVPARNDSFLVRYASAAQYADLLAAGVHIALFEGGLLHTKSLTIDGQVAVFGSVNLDMRSLWLNFEISLFVYDPEFTARLRALQQSYLEDSQLLDAAVWARRPLRQRFTEDTMRLVGPLL